jgi:hypothetical protein
MGTCSLLADATCTRHWRVHNGSPMFGSERSKAYSVEWRVMSCVAQPLWVTSFVICMCHLSSGLYLKSTISERVKCEMSAIGIKILMFGGQWRISDCY